MNPRIVLATPHARYDSLEHNLRSRHGMDVRRARGRAELTPEALAEFSPAYVFLPHWSWKVPSAVFGRFETVVFHMTDVPFGRGGSPLQNLVVRGIENTRLSALQCVEAMDAGPVYAKRDLSTLGSAEEVFLRAALLMEEMIVDIVNTRRVPEAQQGEVVEFRRRTPEQGDIGASGSLSEIHDLIRMLDASGYPPAYLEVGQYRLEFSRASLKPGEILADVRISRRGEAA